MLERVRGFSLVELMVVVAVLGILAAIVAPSFQGTYEEALLSSASRELISAVRMAHGQAVATGRVTRLRFEPGKGTYSIEAAGGDGWGGTAAGPGFAPVKGLPFDGGRIDPRIRVAVQSRGEAPEGRGESPAGRESARGGAETIHFRPDGTADPRVVVLEDREGFSIELRIDSSTSRVMAARRPRGGRA